MTITKNNVKIWQFENIFSSEKEKIAQLEQ